MERKLSSFKVKSAFKRILCGVLCCSVLITLGGCSDKPAGSSQGSSQSSSQESTQTSSQDSAADSSDAAASSTDDSSDSSKQPDADSKDESTDKPDASDKPDTSASGNSVSLTVANESISTDNDTVTLSLSLSGAPLKSDPAADNIYLTGALEAYKVTSIKMVSDNELDVELALGDDKLALSLGSGLLTIDKSCFENSDKDGFYVSSVPVKLHTPTITLDKNSGAQFENGVLSFELDFLYCSPVDNFDKSCVTVKSDDPAVALADAKADAETDEAFISLNTDKDDIDAAIDAVMGTTLTISADGTNVNADVSTTIYFSHPSVYAEVISEPDGDNIETVLLHAVNGRFSDDLSAQQLTFKHDLNGVSVTSVERDENSDAVIVTIQTSDGDDLSGKRTQLTLAEGALEHIWGTPAHTLTTNLIYRSADPDDKQSADDVDTGALLAASGGSENEDDDKEEVQSAVNFEEATKFIKAVGDVSEKVVEAVKVFKDVDISKFAKFAEIGTLGISGVAGGFEAVSLILEWTGAVESTDDKLDKIYDQLLDMQKKLDEIKVEIDAVKKELHDLTQKVTLDDAQNKWQTAYDMLTAQQNMINTYKGLIDGQLFSIIRNGSLHICYRVITAKELSDMLDEYISTHYDDTQSAEAISYKADAMEFYDNFKHGEYKLSEGEYLIPAIRKDENSKKSYDGYDLACDSSGNVYEETYNIKDMPALNGKTVYQNMTDWDKLNGFYTYEIDTDNGFTAGCVIDILAGALILLAQSSDENINSHAEILSSIICDQIVAQATYAAANSTEFDHVVGDYKALAFAFAGSDPNTASPSAFQAYCDYLACLYNFVNETAPLRESMASYIIATLEAGCQIACEIENYRQAFSEGNLTPLLESAKTNVNLSNTKNSWQLAAGDYRNNGNWQYSYIKNNYISMSYIKPLHVDKIFIDDNKGRGFRGFDTYSAITNVKHTSYAFIYCDADGNKCASGTGDNLTDLGLTVTAGENTICGDSFTSDDMTDFIQRCRSNGLSVKRCLLNAGYPESLLNNFKVITAGNESLKFSFRKDVKSKKLYCMFFDRGKIHANYYVLDQSTISSQDMTLYYTGPEFVSWDTVADINIDTYTLDDITCTLSVKYFASASHTHHWWITDEEGFNSETTDALGYFIS